MRRYDAILLDVGATLLEFHPEHRVLEWAAIIGADPGQVDNAWRTAQGAARELVGYETPEEYAAFRAEVCSVMLEALGYRGDRAAAVSAMSDAWIRVGWEPFPDVRPVLSELCADGYRLGVVSNWTATLGTTLAHVELAAYFDVVACSAVVGAMKPDARIFHHALDTLKVDAARALHIGDHYEADVLGARAAGMDAVLIAREAAETPGGETAATIRTLHELRTFLA